VEALNRYRPQQRPCSRRDKAHGAWIWPHRAADRNTLGVLHTREVAGSSPAVPIKVPAKRPLFPLLANEQTARITREVSPEALIFAPRVSAVDGVSWRAIRRLSRQAHVFAREPARGELRVSRHAQVARPALASARVLAAPQRRCSVCSQSTKCMRVVPFVSVAAFGGEQQGASSSTMPAVRRGLRCVWNGSRHAVRAQR
jgi:hypothetical protein